MCADSARRVVYLCEQYTHTRVYVYSSAQFNEFHHAKPFPFGVFSSYVSQEVSYRLFTNWVRVS